MNKYKSMPDGDLMEKYVPDVYQPSIYAIDYQKLKDIGIKLIFFGIDDMIADTEAHDPPKEAVTLFENLKNMGFKLMLLSNAKEERVKDYTDKLGISGHYILKANKPLTMHFQSIQGLGGLEKGQMAHVGMAIRDDVLGGNSFGIITCLVCRTEKTNALRNPNPRHKTEDQKLLDELLERRIWRMHHLNIPNDQYYQLGEQPPYIQTQNIAEAAATAAYLIRIRKLEADKDKPFTFDEFMRSSFNNNLNNEMQALRNHLLAFINITATWADVKDERELEESELFDGEISGVVFTVGCYTIRNTVCLHRDDDTDDPSQKIHVISAKHKNMSDWQEICSIDAESIRLDESLKFIGTVKYDASEPDEREMLFVFKKSIAGLIHDEYWYRLKSDGTVNVYENSVCYAW